MITIEVDTVYNQIVRETIIKTQNRHIHTYTYTYTHTYTYILSVLSGVAMPSYVIMVTGESDTEQTIIWEAVSNATQYTVMWCVKQGNSCKVSIILCYMIISFDLWELVEDWCGNDTGFSQFLEKTGTYFRLIEPWKWSESLCKTLNLLYICERLKNMINTYFFLSTFLLIPA